MSTPKYKKVINSDILFLSCYKAYTPIIERLIDKIDGTVICDFEDPMAMSSNFSSILLNSKEFYTSLPGIYPTLFNLYIHNPNNSFTFRKIKSNDRMFGDTTPYFGTKNSKITSGFNHTFDDYVTAIHEYSHGIASMLYPGEFFDVEKYCLVESDGIFFEFLGNEYTQDRFNAKSEGVNSTLLSLSYVLQDAAIIFSKIDMYKNARFKWTRDNLESHLSKIGYDESEFDSFLSYRICDNFNYLVSYLIAIELYLIYKQDQRDALDILLRIIRKNNCNAKEYLDYVTSLGINPGENIYKYFDTVIEKDKEVGYGQRLQYRFK